VHHVADGGQFNQKNFPEIVITEIDRRQIKTTPISGYACGLRDGWDPLARIMMS